MAVWDGRLNPCVSISTELALAQMIDFLSVGRNRRPVRPAALHAEFDFRALFSRFQNTKGGIPYSGTFCPFSFWASKKKMGYLPRCPLNTTEKHIHLI